MLSKTLEEAFKDLGRGFYRPGKTLLKAMEEAAKGLGRGF
jgi:hypothetical protein